MVSANRDLVLVWSELLGSDGFVKVRGRASVRRSQARVSGTGPRGTGGRRDPGMDIAGAQTTRALAVGCLGMSIGHGTGLTIRRFIKEKV